MVSRMVFDVPAVTVGIANNIDDETPALRWISLIWEVVSESWVSGIFSSVLATDSGVPAMGVAPILPLALWLQRLQCCWVEVGVKRMLCV